MGTYINPENETKEDFLKREGEMLETFPQFQEIPSSKMLICWMNNGFFSAAALVYDEREYDAFTDPADKREKYFFLVEKKSLYSVIPLQDLYLLEK